MAHQQHVFAHIGDTHVFRGDPRLQDKLAALRQVIVWCRAAAERKVLAAILWPGDLNHKAGTAEDRIVEENLLIPIMLDLASLAPVVVPYGNHDAPGSLDVFRTLNSIWPVIVVDRPETVTVRCATGIDARIACLPYPHRAGLVGAGVAHEDIGQTARQLLEPQFALFAEELRQARAAGEIPLFIGHVNVGGSLSSTGQPQIGREIELDPGLLARLDTAAYKGLNHIHKHQVVAGSTVYAGSICRQDFGENEPKGFVVVTVEDTTCEWEFIPLDVPAQYLVEGQLTREGFTIASVDGRDIAECECNGTGVIYETRMEHDHHPACDGSCRDCPVPKEVDVSYQCGHGLSWAGADIKVRYTYKRSERGVLDQAHIFAEFAGCRNLKLDPIAEVERDIRAPEVVEAVTMDGKAEAYCQRKGITWTPTLGAKLTALQQQTPETILAEVAALTAAAGTMPAPSADRQVA